MSAGSSQLRPGDGRGLHCGAQLDGGSIDATVNFAPATAGAFIAASATASTRPPSPGLRPGDGRGLHCGSAVNAPVTPAPPVLRPGDGRGLHCGYVVERDNAAGNVLLRPGDGRGLHCGAWFDANGGGPGDFAPATAGAFIAALPAASRSSPGGSTSPRRRPGPSLRPQAGHIGRGGGVIFAPATAGAFIAAPKT